MHKRRWVSRGRRRGPAEHQGARQAQVCGREGVVTKNWRKQRGPTAAPPPWISHFGPWFEFGGLGQVSVKGHTALEWFLPKDLVLGSALPVTTT